MSVCFHCHVDLHDLPESAAYCKLCGHPVRQPCPYCQVKESELVNPEKVAQWVSLEPEYKIHDGGGCGKPLKYCPKCGQRYRISKMECGICTDSKGKHISLVNPFAGQRSTHGDTDNANAIDFTRYIAPRKLPNEDMVEILLDGTNHIVTGVLSGFGYVLLINEAGIDMYRSPNLRDKEMPFLHRISLAGTQYGGNLVHDPTRMKQLLNRTFITEDGYLVLTDSTAGKASRVFRSFLPDLATNPALSSPIWEGTDLLGCTPVGDKLALLVRKRNDGCEVKRWFSGGVDTVWGADNVDPLTSELQDKQIGDVELPANGLRPFSDNHSLFFFDTNGHLYRVFLDGTPNTGQCLLKKNKRKREIYFGAVHADRIVTIDPRGWEIIKLSGEPAASNSFPDWWRKPARNALPAFSSRFLVVPGYDENRIGNAFILGIADPSVPILFPKDSYTWHPSNGEDVHNLIIADYQDVSLVLSIKQGNVIRECYSSRLTDEREQAFGPKTASSLKLQMGVSDGAIVLVHKEPGDQDSIVLRMGHP